MLSVVASSTRDVVSGRVFAGGPALYSSLALCFLGFEDFVVITCGGVTYSLLRRMGVNLIRCGGLETVFEIVLGDGRKLKLVGRGCMDLRGLHCSISSYLIISLTMGEVPMEVVGELVRGRRTVVDVQGFVRSVNDWGEVFNDYSGFYRLLDLDCDELVLRGEWYEFPPRCRGSGVVRCARDYGVSMIVTDGSGLTHYSTPDGVSGIVQPPQLIHGNTLGSGDVFTAVFAYAYFIKCKSFDEAVATATSAASLRLRDSIPWYSANEVEALSNDILNSRRRITY